MENTSLVATAATQAAAPGPLGPERVPLVKLAAQGGGLSAATLSRIVPTGPADRGPGRVSVAAFQSCV